MRAVADAPSPLAIPVLVAPVDPNRPAVTDSRVAPLLIEARGMAIPAAPTREVGGRRPDGRGPVVPTEATLEVVDDACPVTGLLRWERTRDEADAVLGGATLVATGGRCTPPSAIPRGGGAEVAVWDIPRPTVFRAGIDAVTGAGAMSAFATLVIR
jgi:hypothetical protein